MGVPKRKRAPKGDSKRKGSRPAPKVLAARRENAECCPCWPWVPTRAEVEAQEEQKIRYVEQRIKERLAERKYKVKFGRPSGRDLTGQCKERDYKAYYFHKNHRWAQSTARHPVDRTCKHCDTWKLDKCNPSNVPISFRPYCEIRFVNDERGRTDHYGVGFYCSVACEAKANRKGLSIGKIGKHWFRRLQPNETNQAGGWQVDPDNSKERANYAIERVKTELETGSVPGRGRPSSKKKKSDSL